MDLSTTLNIVKSIVKALKGIANGDIDFENLSSGLDKLSSMFDSVEGSSAKEGTEKVAETKDAISGK